MRVEVERIADEMDGTCRRSASRSIPDVGNPDACLDERGLLDKLLVFSSEIYVTKEYVNIWTYADFDQQAPAA